MKKVLLRAPLLTYSGYGTHARQIFRWLKTVPDIKLKVQALSWGVTPWMISPQLEGGLVNEIMGCTISSSDEKFDVTLQLQLPNEWDPSMGKVNIGMSAVVETDRCNPTWVDCCNRMDHVVVPSNHAKNALEISGTVVAPLSVVPEAFYEEIVSDNLPSLGIDFDTDFNFLLVGQMTGNNPENDRKNIFYAIKWLCDAFSTDADVGIVIKTNSGKNTKIDRRVTSRMLEQLLQEARKGPYPRVHFLHGAMSQAEIAALYRHPKIKAIVAPTKGEGFGLPLLEAAASGLPVIATNWSGHLDFLSLGKFIPLSYTLEEIHKSRIDGSIFISGAQWALVDEEDFKKKVSKFRKSWLKPTEWAKELQPKIISNYSQDAINASYDQILGRYLKS